MKRLQNFVASTTVEDRNNLENNISELELQLNQLREKLSNNEERHQKQLTMLGALGSAIEQVCNAIKLCEDGGEPGLVDTFWEELGDIKNGDYVFTKALPQYVDNDEETQKLATMKLSEIKDYAAEMGLTNSYVKSFGSVRSKTTWINAIIAFKLEDSSEDVQEENTPNDEVNTEDNVIDVVHNNIPNNSNDNEPTDENISTSSDIKLDVSTDEWETKKFTPNKTSPSDKEIFPEDW